MELKLFVIKCWWLSTEKMTVRVLTKDSIIIEAAPIVKKFLGQPLENLIHWMSYQPGFKMMELNDEF